jgi:hypothetical protein
MSRLLLSSSIIWRNFIGSCCWTHLFSVVMFFHYTSSEWRKSSDGSYGTDCFDSFPERRAVGVESCNAINPMIRTMNELQAIAEESVDWCWAPQRSPVPGTNTPRGQPSISQKVIASGWWDETYFIVIPLPNIEGRHLLVGDCFLWELIMQSIIIELAQVFYDRPIRFVDLTIYFGEFPTSIALGLLVTGVNIYHRDVEGVGRRNLWRS